MIHEAAGIIGERIDSVGTGFEHQADAYRVAYSNPREVPELNVFDTIGKQLHSVASTLIRFSTPE